MEMAENIVEVTRCKTAGDLLDAIAGTRSLFNSAPPYSWLFRGVARSEYTLTPSALRAGSLERFNLGESDANQIDAEWKVLKALFELGNLRGMPLPEDSHRTRQLVESFHPTLAARDREGDAKWPPSELLPLCGLGQHYGVPTRLLDWSYDPRIAAYFAASGVMSHLQDCTPPIRDAVRRYVSHTEVDWNEDQFDADHHGPIKMMAVWAFNKMFDESLRLRERFAPPAEPVPYETVTIPYATNPNIQAQQGVFTVVRHRYDSNCVDRAPLDETMHAYLRRCFPDVLKTRQSTIPFFFKFELPWQQYGSLLRQLANAGVNASTVFPGFYGVVGAIRERFWCWDAAQTS